jgi:hypothetical protein
MKTNKLIIIFAGVLIITVVVAFFGGMQYQKTQGRSQFQGQMNQNGQTGQLRQRSGVGAGAVNGEVLNIDAKTLTVKLPDGSSKIILLSDKTVVNQATASATSNIKTGEQVMVFGAANPDGSVTASNIQINPSRIGPRNNQ